MDTNNEYLADRRKIFFRPNDYVQRFGETFKISQLISFDEIIGINIENGRAEKLLIKDLKPVSEPDLDNNFIHRDLDDISDSDWRKIEKRFEMIQPLIQNASRKEIEIHAKKIDVHFTTLYRWLRNYQATGTLTGLLPKKRGPKEGLMRIESTVERVIENAIKNTYLTKQKHSVEMVIKEVFSECKRHNIVPPGHNTIRRRIHALSEYDRLKRRGERSKARTKLEAAPGEYRADYPLQVVQIDHTPVDIILVDDERRKPIGRPFITLAIDIYSRMITGYYLSLDPPSTTSVAMCIAHSVTPKNNYLLRHDIDSEWPVWGFMDTIHTDNGAEFRSETLQRSCISYDINLEFRPVKQTNFGGHIERLIGTIMKKVHSIPGTTFSNIQERSEYDSDGNACMTFSEFEKWLLTLITKYYHKRKHSSLGISPQDKWDEGIFGSLTSEGIGYLPKPSDNDTVYRDFLPIYNRTVQKNGINIDGLNYYDHVLRSFIHQVDPLTNKKQLFIFRRDPRDISYIWFFEPNLQKYYKIPLANQTLPKISIWELTAIRKEIKTRGYTFSEHTLLTVHEEMQDIINKSSQKTRKARRQEQASKVHSDSIATTAPSTKNLNTEPLDSTPLDDDLWDDDIPEFD